jgi:hypothetical protein
MVPFSTAGLAELARQAIRRGQAFASKHRRLLQTVVSGAILIFLGLYIYRHARELASYEFSLDAASLALASVLILFVNFLTPLTWGLILSSCLQTRLSWRESLRVWYLSQVSKYLPGSVWNYVSRVFLCGQKGISAPRSILSMVLEIVLILLAQGVVVLISLPFWLEGHESVLWVLLILPLAGLILQPRLFNSLLGWVARKSGLRDPPLVDLRPGNVGGLLAIYTFGAIVVGLAFYFFVNGLVVLPLQRLPALAGIVNLSFIAGFVAPFAPYGLGVREGLLTLLLSQYIPAPVAAMVSLASRLWFTAAELVGLSISLALQHVRANNPKGL